MFDWETIKQTWPFAVLLGGHLIRTEASRAVTKTRLDHGEANFKRIEEQLKTMAKDQKDNHATLASDIKHLLERSR